MTHISYQKVVDEIKEHGIDAVKKRVETINRTVASDYDKHIKTYEESEALKRREAREEESLSISRKARSDSRRANIIAISAIIIATSAIILNIITYMWPPK